ncbi:hypothetical protein ACQP00_30030 [Dactylosporangium sp. CS-047395]|uniref:hypothetical protein n=1 Tax=Dactylosporangium sp. CS-047395 TaxID=3239936 RepID=UPI003D919F66
MVIGTATLLAVPPSHVHEILIEMFRGRPQLAADLLTDSLHMMVPPFEEAQLSPADLTAVAPTEYRADAVVTLDARSGTALAVVIEVQLKVDARKRLSWPVYLTTLHARLHSPVVVLVLCRSRQVADWSAVPIRMGPGSVVTPMALGPDQIPVVTDLHTARRIPELAVLSAMVHGTVPDPTPIFEALLTALDVIDEYHADLYTDLVFSVLPDTAKDFLEEFMTATSHRYHSEFARRYFDQGEAQGEARGKAQGEATSLLAILEARGIEIPDEMRSRIAECTDPVQLGTWIRRAATADKIQDLDELADG